MLTEATEIDLDRREVRFRHLPTGEEGREPFDELVLATGSRPLRPALPGIDARGIFDLHTLDDAAQLREALDEKRPRRVTVVGAGYVGLEMVAAFRRLGLEVDLIGRSAEVMGTLDDDMGALVSQAVRRMGATTYLGEEVKGFETVNGRVTGVITGLRTVGTDLVLLGMGVRPNAALAADAGLSLGVRGSVKVDASMRTSVEGVWAAGDCVESRNIVSQQPVWASLATVSNKTGRIAGRNITGDHLLFPGILQTAITGVGKVEVARTGLKSEELEGLGLQGVAAQITGTTTAGYLPQTEGMTVRLIGETGSGRLLGGQIVGGQGSGKRIDTVVTALQAGMRVDEFVDLDLSYAPPFSPTWDPLLIAARQLAKML